MTLLRNIRPGRLRKHRRLMLFDRWYVARRLGHKDTSTLSRWERGVAIPSLEHAFALSKLYKTSVDELFYDLGKRVEEQILKQEEFLKGCRDP